MADITLSGSGPPDIRLPEPSAEITSALDAFETVDEVAALVAAHPNSLEGWAELGERAERARSGIAGDLEAYAYFRVGYHRGLDALRKNGWGGSGYVRWEHAPNRGFLRCLDGLRRMAGSIGEASEEERCAEFLAMLDPGASTAR
jgi:hypothetical protein